MSFRTPCSCPLCQREIDERIHTHHNQFRALLEHLDERQRRWVAGLEAYRLGHGGEKLVAAISGLDRKTVRRGRQEVLADFEGVSDERLRRLGAGGKSAKKKSPVPSRP